VLANLTQLQYLSLDYNNIAELPTGWLPNRPRILGVSLRHNNIFALPVGVLAQSPFVQLDVRQNRVQHVPLYYATFPGIPTTLFATNPWTNSTY